MKRRYPDPEFDRAIIGDVGGPVAGIDEVGRGALAGPVVAAAVVLPTEIALHGVTDSKMISPGAREEAYERICSAALCWSIGEVEAGEVDRINIRQATFLAMRKAIAGLTVSPAVALVDGRDDPGLDIPVRSFVRGDSLSLSIAAASIVAKVTRDRAMRSLAARYPEYGFERHVGYGTKVHREAIMRFGATPFHRTTFLGSIKRNHTTNDTD